LLRHSLVCGDVTDGATVGLDSTVFWNLRFARMSFYQLAPKFPKFNEYIYASKTAQIKLLHPIFSFCVIGEAPPAQDPYLQGVFHNIFSAVTLIIIGMR
jgi:hypothetical protein